MILEKKKCIQKKVKVLPVTHALHTGSEQSQNQNSREVSWITFSCLLISHHIYQLPGTNTESDPESQDHRQNPDIYRILKIRGKDFLNLQKFSTRPEEALLAKIQQPFVKKSHGKISGYGGISQHNKENIPQTHREHYAKWRKAQSISINIRN